MKRLVLKLLVFLGEKLEDRILVGDEGCLWPVERARVALKSSLLFILLYASCHAQSKAATIANFSLRAADSAQTCVLLHQPGGREIFLPIHNCAGIAGYNMTIAGGAWYVDRKLVQHGHPRWAKAQWVAIAFDAAAIGFTTYHQVKGIRPGGTR